MPEEVKKLGWPIPLQPGAVYGPLHSKRLGSSLGINLLPTTKKLCNLDCLYCFYGRTDFKAGPDECPPAEQILYEVETALKKDQLINYITFSGNGAATLHPDFPAIVRKITELRDEYYPGTPVAILSNSTGIEGDEIIEAFDLFDLPIMKLDTAEATVFKKLNRPRRGVKLHDIINILKSMRGITIQTLFVEGLTNCRGEVLEKWIEAVGEINPAAVQIYTLDRSMPESGLIKLEDDELFRLADYASTALGLPVKAYID